VNSISRNGGIAKPPYPDFGASPFKDHAPGRLAHSGAAEPLKLIAVSQEVQIVEGSDGVVNRRDVLDQSWARLLKECGCLALPVPNQPRLAAQFLDEIPIDGVLLTSGNELTINGGVAPERDRTEFVLVTNAVHNKLPVLGVGRGMQIIQRLFSVQLNRVKNHISLALEIEIDGRRQTVVSDHRFGATETAPELKVWARADDSVVKAIKNERYGITGIMWSPEKTIPLRTSDIELIRRTFNTNRRTARL